MAAEAQNAMTDVKTADEAPSPGLPGSWAARIGALREGLGLTMDSFSMLLGASKSSVSRFESGLAEPPGSVMRLVVILEHAPPTSSAKWLRDLREGNWAGALLDLVIVPSGGIRDRE